MIPFAECMFSSGEWCWVKRFAKYLIHNNNKKAELILKRYAKGVFTKKELEINQGKVTPKEIRKFAKSVLQWSVSKKVTIKSKGDNRKK